VSLVCEVLELEGYEAHGALIPELEPPGSAEAFAAAHRPAAILFDLSPPFAAAWDVLQRLERATAQRAPPIILTSTSHYKARSFHLRRRALLLPKPFNPTQLVSALSAVFQRHQPESSEKAPLSV
jgi:DNA-binding response OmpR family regulator